MDVRFKNEIGLELAGRLEWPEYAAGPAPVVIFAHGYDSGKDSPRGVLVAERARAQGFAVFLIDFTGHGESQGTMRESTIDRQVEDLRAAIDFLANMEGIDLARIGLCGASSGGLTALKTALSDTRVGAVALRGPRTNGMTPRAAEFKVPILIVQGSLDPLLPESETFFRGLPVEKSLEIITGADHLFSRAGQIEEVAELTARWFAKIFFARAREAA